jgi:hypothetical protein
LHGGKGTDSKQTQSLWQRISGHDTAPQSVDGVTDLQAKGRAVQLIRQTTPKQWLPIGLC